MKTILGIIAMSCIMALTACWSGKDPYLEGVDPTTFINPNGEPTQIEGVWNSVGMSSSCVLVDSVFIPEDLFAKIKFTFSGNHFEYVENRVNGCDSPGDITYFYRITGTFTLSATSINLKVSGMTITLGQIGYDLYIFMPPGTFWGIPADSWQLGVAVNIAGKEPNTNMAAYRSPAVGDVMPGTWLQYGTTLEVGFDKTPADGYAAPAGTIEYSKQ